MGRLTARRCARPRRRRWWPRVERALRRQGAPVGNALLAMTRSRNARRRRARSRDRRPDQSPVGGHVHRHHLLEHGRIDMPIARGRRDAGSPKDRGGRPCRARHQAAMPGPRDVERPRVQRRRGLDPVSSSSSPPRARDQHAVRAFAGEGQRGRGSEAARGAGDQRQTAGQATGRSRSHEESLRPIRRAARAGDPPRPSRRRARSDSRR